MAARHGCPALLLTALLTALLSACEAGGGLTPPPELPKIESGLIAADGTHLAASRWEAQEPTAIVLALHGYGDHADSTFALAGARWASSGLTTIAFDQRGFGRNPSRSYWPGAEALISDLRAVSGQVRRQWPCLPLAVLGHSMGGGVVLGAAPDLAADGLILAAPAIWGGTQLNPFHRLAAWTAASIAPEKRFTGRGVVRIQASDNIEMLGALARDPLYLRPPSAREIWGLVRVTDKAEAAAVEVATPALLLLGEKDQILPERSVRRVFERLTGPRTVIAYPDGWHLLFRDLQAERVWTDVANWVSRLPVPDGCAG